MQERKKNEVLNCVKLIHNLFLLIIIYIFLNLFSPISSKVASSAKFVSQQVLKVIYPRTSRKMCAVLISVIFYSSMVDG